MSFSNVSENRVSTINGQQIFPILYSDPLDFHQNKSNCINNDSFSYIVNIKKNLIKEFIETKEKADNEIYEIYSIWLEDKDSDFEKDTSTNIFGSIKLDLEYHNSSSVSSLLSLNYSNSSMNISNDPNTFLDDSVDSLFNNVRSNESLNINYSSYPMLYSNKGSSI